MASVYRHGLLAERRVALKYQQSGFVILDRNWRCRVGELDVVALSGSTLAVIEVKWRRSYSYGGARAAVGPVKQARIKAATTAWLTAHPEWLGRDDVSVRFDVAALTGGSIEIIERAFE